MPDKSDANAAPDLRKTDRRELLTQAIFVSQNVRLKSAVTIDISTGGLSLNLPQAMEIGQACAVSFDVPGQDAKLRTLIRGTVVSCVSTDSSRYRIGVRHVESDPISRQLIEEAVDHFLKNKI